MKLKINTISGFTLLEVIIVIAIIGIVATIANPFYDSYIRRSEVAKAARGFESALQIAKQNARISGRTMTVCGTDDINAIAITCLDDKDKLNKFFNKPGSSSTSDSIGWVVFYGKIKDGKVESVEKVHKIVAIDQRRVRMAWNGNHLISLSPRNETGSSGTMRVYSRGGDMHESSVTVSTLGNITYRK